MQLRIQRESLGQKRLMAILEREVVKAICDDTVTVFVSNLY